MNNIIKKSILFILILTIVVIGINIFMSVRSTNNDEYESDTISKSDAKALEIYNHKVVNLYQRNGKDSKAIIKMKNISNLNISEIFLYYEESDKSGKVISDSKIHLDMTLSPNEVIQAQFTPKDYTDTIEVTGYTYIVEDCEVGINLKENDININENHKYLENSKNYEVMSISKIDKNRAKEDDSSVNMEIKNVSEKNLGNIVLKIAEINKNKEIVKIDHIIYNSILKPDEEAQITVSLYDSNYDIKILGYTYDDMENKSNIDIDLITHKVDIIDNKQ